MTLVFLFSFWLTVTTYAEKLLSEESSGHKKWDLTSAIPLDDNGNSVEAALGKNPDVHYIYVCIKVSLTSSLSHHIRGHVCFGDKNVGLNYKSCGTTNMVFVDSL